MKILHTADLHLREYGDVRWKALEAILDMAARENADLVAVSGDLFDRGVNLLRLQDEVRRAFTALPFTVVILPGNHDHAAYAAGMYLGERAIVLRDWRTPHLCGEVAVWGLPFEPVGRAEVMARLRSMNGAAQPGLRHLLLYHGELLDAVFSRSEFGEEGGDRYMPSRLSFFRDLRFEAVLAGHFHTAFRVWEPAAGQYFVYPGSPVSVTSRETGRRAVNLFEAGGPPREQLLDTPHFEERVVLLDPFDGVDPLEKVCRVVEDLHPAATLILTVAGYIGRAGGLSEQELAGRIRQVAAGRCAGEPRILIRDIRSLLEDALFNKFQEKLSSLEAPPEEKKKMLEMAVRAMMEAAVC